MKLADVVEQMKTVMMDGAKPLETRFEECLVAMADFLRLGIGRTGDRSTGAVLMVERVGESRHLAFAYPPHLASGNYVPVSGDSVAGRVVESRSSVIANNLKEESHQGIFELIPDTSGEVRPIQKMIASPMLDGQGEVFAVIEVNRTGTTPSDAGADFNPQDVSNLELCCKAFAPYVHKIWTAVQAQS